MRLGPLPLYLEKALPGEFDGTLNPEDYGFEVHRLTSEEIAAAEAEIPHFIRRIRMRTGIDHQGWVRYLNSQPYDPEPARQLAAQMETVGHPYACTFGQAELVVDEGVFVPTLTKVSPFLLQNVDFRPDEIMLDAFAGSGAFGINAALRGSRAVCFDASTQAANCAQANAERNGVAGNVDVRHGSWETITPGEIFDLIVANPPLIPREPTTPLESALFDNSLAATRQLIAALPNILAKHGRCYLATSDVIDRNDYRVNIAELCRKSGLTMEIVDQLHLPYESYRIHKITRRTPTWWVRPLLKKVVEHL